MSAEQAVSQAFGAEPDDPILAAQVTRAAAIHVMSDAVQRLSRRLLALEERHARALAAVVRARAELDDATSCLERVMRCET